MSWHQITASPQTFAHAIKQQCNDAVVDFITGKQSQTNYKLNADKHLDAA